MHVYFFRPTPRIIRMCIAARVRSESESRNNSCRHSTARCTCVRRYYLHLHNAETPARAVRRTPPRRNPPRRRRTRYASPSPSFAFPSPLRLLLRADVSRHVSRVRLWEPIQPRFVNERRMNEASRPSGGCARVYRLLNLHFRRNARRAARRNDAAQRVGDAKITRGRIVYSFRLRTLAE